ncbi:MAG TPA: hypothetical protein VJW16_04680 [Lysobacter sp.]|nr:hypothetical protein [Lysobacter sp.]
MRQVFASPRLENVEGIAQFLEAQGIEVRITHGRSYKGGWGGRRTYRDSEGGPLPAVWVVKSEDQPRARQLLREAGLLDSTRGGGSDSFLAPSAHVGSTEPGTAKPPAQKRAFRYKIGLLIAIVVAVGFAWNASRKTTTGVPATRAAATRAPATSAPAPTAAKAAKPVASHATPATSAKATVEPVPGAYPVETPPVLATTLATTELDVHAAKVACLRIDGTPASDAALAQWTLPAGVKLDCRGNLRRGALGLDVRNYRTDGSGTGTVELAVSSTDANGLPSTQVRTLLVRRIEADWHVVRVLAVR